MSKIRSRAVGKPEALYSDTELEDKRSRRIEEIAAIMGGVKGGVCERTSPRTVHLRWFVNPDHPDWGKVFMAYDLDRSLDGLMEELKLRPFPPPDWDHWKVFEMERKTATRDTVKTRYRKLMNLSKDTRTIDIAYGRILGDLWTDGKYHRV